MALGPCWGLLGGDCGIPEATWSFPGSSFGLMVDPRMPFGVSCASFEGPPRQSMARFESYLQYFRRSTDFTGMKDTSFQRGFWEAPEILFGIICEALECPAVFLGPSWYSPGVSWVSPRGP